MRGTLVYDKPSLLDGAFASIAFSEVLIDTGF
jgi:hypothetical protein